MRITAALPVLIATAALLSVAIRDRPKVWGLLPFVGAALFWYALVILWRADDRRVAEELRVREAELEDELFSGLE